MNLCLKIPLGGARGNLFEVMDIFISLIVGMGSRLYVYIGTYQVVHFKFSLF